MWKKINTYDKVILNALYTLRIVERKKSKAISIKKKQAIHKSEQKCPRKGWKIWTAPYFYEYKLK